MTGYLSSATTVLAIAPTIGLALAITPSPMAEIAVKLAAEPAAELAVVSGIPTVTCLPKVFTVADVWREWKEGVAGGPAIESLEEQYGHRWRPGNTMTVQFCRRKVVLDALKALIARGRSEEEAI
jgi:Transcriptional activator of glycolytic enzymes